MGAINLNFLCNNVKSLQTFKKLLKLFNYLKKKYFPMIFSFLLETNSAKENEIKWKDDFDGNLYFPRSKSNSFEVLIGFSSNKRFTVKRCLCDENSLILIL